MSQEMSCGNSTLREKERVCVCVNGFIVDSHTHAPLLYLALRPDDQVRHFINIHVGYMTLSSESVAAAVFVLFSSQAHL